MSHQFVNIEGYFDAEEKAAFTDTLRAIVYGSECSIMEALAFLADLAEQDNSPSEPIITYGDDVERIKAALAAI